VEKANELLQMFAFVRSDSVLVSFWPPGGLEEAQAPNPFGEAIPLDVVPLSTQSRERGEPTVKPSEASDPPLASGVAPQVPSKPSDHPPIYRGKPHKGHFRKSSPII
jgi:hypothetical protein